MYKGCEYNLPMQFIFVILWGAFYVWTTNLAGATDGKTIIVILSQSNKRHAEEASQLRDKIVGEAAVYQGDVPVVYLSHSDFPLVGGWAVLPLIPPLAAKHPEKASWFIFIEDTTQINLAVLNFTLQKHNCNEEIWLGHALHDEEPTIIHHFAFYENPKDFKYPNSGSGFAISGTLMRRLNERLQTNPPRSDFSIDHAFELAFYIWNDGNGPGLTHSPNFCIKAQPDCATFPSIYQACSPGQQNHEAIYFAVKTCEKFHGNRVKVVKETWAAQAENLEFFSDVEDDSIPTVSLGIPNTEKGHCIKTFEIIKHAAKKQPEMRWTVIADDDTILSVHRLENLLRCYNASTPVALGERYGYNIYQKGGYNYITGGGGIVLSRNLVEKLAETRDCECPSLSSPDDMFLGVCLARLGVEITHSPHFHQARPVDYPQEYLHQTQVISFHKHWMIDPIDVYNKWFAGKSTETRHHVEL